MVRLEIVFDKGYEQLHTFHQMHVSSTQVFLLVQSANKLERSANTTRPLGNYAHKRQALR